MGRPPMIPDEEILQLVRDHPDPVVGTAEIADALDFSRNGTKKRLDQLVEQGDLENKKIGTVSVFWLPETEE